jgi:hypothetical protein
VANLSPGNGDFIRISSAGDRLYLNIYDILHDSADPYRDLHPGLDPLVGGQTWVTGPCGEDAVLVGEGISFDLESEALGTLTPVFYGEDSADVDPSLACDVRGDGRNRIYRVDLSGASLPELLLEGWSCGIDVARMVASYQTDDVHELWRVPNFPDLAGAVRLAADIHEEIGWDANYNYYLDTAQALHAVDIRTGTDEVLQTGVLRASGGATGSPYLLERNGPTRLLWLAKVADEPEATYLYRGETGEVVNLADLQPSPDGAWGFDIERTFIYYRPSGDVEPGLRVFDLNGAPLAFPDGVRPEFLIFSADVLGSIDGPNGPQWVHARPGVAEATVLDMPWDPEPDVYTWSSEVLYYFLDGQLYRMPLDGGPTIEVLDTGFRYTDDDLLAIHDGQLFHVDWHTNTSTLLKRDVGTYAVDGELRGGMFESRGIFYTDVSTPEAPSLWFMPTALLPGGS